MDSVNKSLGIIKQTLIAVLVTSISLTSIAQTERVYLPELGNSASNVLSTAEEKEYAAGLVRQMRAYNLLVEDPQINEFFSTMGFNLVSHSDQPKAAFTFVVLDQPAINAFAAPGGVVALHSGLILLAKTQDEVAGVLSHEIAHITQLHMYRAFEKAKTMNVLALLAMLGMVLASGGNSEVITGAVLGSQAVAQQAQINFTRHNEIEADRVGIRTLASTGYDPQGMADFFSRMGQSNRANGEGPPVFLRTHPVSVDRIAEAEDRIQNLPEVIPDEGRQFYIVQSRLRALLENNPNVSINYFETELAKEQSDAIKDGLLYGLAISLQKNAQYTRAKDILDDLIARQPSSLAFQLQLANLNVISGHVDEAISSLRDLHRIFPGNKAIALEFGNALLTENDAEFAKEASDILKKQLTTKKDDPALYALYARAANLAGDKVKATEAIAESYYQRGGLQEAISQLEGLERQDDLDYYERARVNARLIELRIEIGELEGYTKSG